QEIPPEVTPVAASQDTAPETPSIPVVTSAPVDHPLPPTPKEDVPEPQAPAIVETRASPVDTQPPHPSFSGPGSSASSFSRDRSESSATTESLSTAKYDRIVSPLESPATFSSRTPLDQSFSNLALGGEAPGWGSPIVHKTAPTEDSSPIDRHENNLSPSQSIATVKESENGPDGQEDTTTQRPLIQPEFIITVGDPQKVGDPISAHIVYTVTTRTTSPRFAKSSFSVLRRYSDFLWLYDMLGHNNPGVIIPPVPEKNAINRFDNTFVQSRRLGLSKCVQKIANHPVLSMDDDFKMFLESDSFALDIKHRRADNSNSGILGTLGSFTGPKFYEIDDWYDNKKSYLDALESQLKGLVKAIELVTKQRAEFATCVSEFAEAISALANSDLSKQLSGSLSILADVEKLYKEIQDKQSKDDALTIMATADEYGRLINSVRLAFGSRVKLYFACQQAETDARRIKAAHEKARRQGRIPTESMASSLAALAEADRKALDAKKEFDDVSRLIKTEMNRFERERIEDFKIAMDQFLDGMINKQKELVKAWEDYQDTLLKRAASNPSPQHPLSNGTQHQVQPETST
ncbi:Vacuolar protein sorting-associated protein 5, partial [Tulasnella sp. 418]